MSNRLIDDMTNEELDYICNPSIADFHTANEILIHRHDDIPVDAYGRTKFTAFWLRDGELQQQTCTHDLDAYITRVTRNSGRTYRLI